VVRGPQVMSGYWKKPEETAAVFVADPAGGAPWFRTGDIVTLDSDGFVRIVDRIKEIIITGGFNVSPSEVERRCAHPDVDDAAVVGVPSERGEDVVAAVVLRSGAELDAEGIRSFLRESLTAYKVPRRVVAVDELPKSLIGKTLRRVVRDRAADTIGRMGYIIAIDQGTTSSRAIVFDSAGTVVSVGQKEHEQLLPRAGWVEHDPMEIWATFARSSARRSPEANLTRHDIEAIGITNQRETTVVWDKNTGKPVYNAIVWQDTRTQPIVDRLAADGGTDRFKETTGLPLSTYFAGTKIAWILENVEGARERAEAGDLLFGTTDTWVLWNLTGGPDGGVHATDVTNASRTLFLDLRTLEWDDDILNAFGVPRSMLPEVRSSSEVYGVAHGSSLLRETPIAGILGDQQAATFGQAAFDKGDAKNTYGTGNFLIFNTGTDIVESKNGLLTTIAYKLGDGETHYALEGSIAVTGSLVQWLRDNLGLIGSADEIEALANTVDDNGGAYLVPAFSGCMHRIGDRMPAEPWSA
jgi:glycerol kinase